METVRLIDAHPSTASTPAKAGHTPPPLRLPKFLARQLAKPLHTSDDVDDLIDQLKAADARGLL